MAQSLYLVVRLIRTFGILGLLGSTGCVPSGAALTRRSAARDLKCSAKSMQIYMLSGAYDQAIGAVYGVRGCGKKLTYVRDTGITVVPNSPAVEDADAPQYTRRDAHDRG